MEIAKGIDAKKYLELDSGDESAWQNAISFLEKRLQERYIDPVGVLIRFEEHLLAKEKNLGFAVLAIDCMLLETLQSFYEGLTDTKNEGLVGYSIDRDNEGFKGLFYGAACHKSR
jgi:hypothetical protein